MTICAIKVCRNYKGRLKTNKEVTYHRIPKDPIARSKWIEIIRKSRGEDVWEPVKTTVICSDHFCSKDLYSVNDGRLRRLKKEAIPRKALFLTSLRTDDDEDDEDKAKSTESNEKTSDDNTKNLCSNITCIAHVISSSTSSDMPGRATSSTIGDERKKENETEIIEDFSDLDSVYDSPRESKMRRDLRRKIRLQKKHTLKIQSLRRKNLRLKKKVASYKSIIIRLLKKDRNIDSDILNTLSDNVKNE